MVKKRKSVGKKKASKGGKTKKLAAPRVRKYASKARRGPKETAGPSSGGKPRYKIGGNILKEWTQSAVAMTGGLHDYNPDELVINKGDGVRVYQDMLRDPYVKAALSIKKLSVARAPHRILPASESEEHQRHAKFIEWNLENMDTTVDTLLWSITNALDVGYSISEMNYKVLKIGEWKGKIGMRSVKSKDPYVYSFKIDQHGNVDKVVQRIYGAYFEGGDFAVTPGTQDQREFDPKKFLITTFMSLYSNPYGSSDLRAAYRAFFIKDWTWKFRAIFIEKWGMPPVVGKFPQGTSEKRRQQLEDVLDSIQNDTVITIPEDLKIEIMNLSMAGRTTEFERAIADLNKEILIGIMGSFLSVEEGKRTGARAQGEVHFSVSKLFVEHLAGVVCETINKNYIKPLIDLNFVTDRYPKYHIDISRVEELLKEIDVDKAFRDMGIPLDKTYFYDKYKRPSPPESQIDRQVGHDPGTPEDPSGTGVGGGPTGFDRLRNDALPEDPQKIGKLRETYRWFFRMHEHPDPEEAAFALAGQEREFYKDHKTWMGHDEARAEFKKAVKIG